MTPLVSFAIGGVTGLAILDLLDRPRARDARSRPLELTHQDIASLRALIAHPPPTSVANNGADGGDATPRAASSKPGARDSDAAVENGVANSYAAGSARPASPRKRRNKSKGHSDG